MNARGLPWWATFEGRAGRGQAHTERAYEIRVLEQSPRREIEVSQQPAASPVAGVECNGNGCGCGWLAGASAGAALHQRNLVRDLFIIH